MPAPGIPALRESVAAFLERTGRLRISPDRVVVTPGAKPIMFFTILALCGPGDEVLYPDPGFPMYESITAFAGATPVPVPLRESNGFRIDVDELAAADHARVEAADHQLPHNPCGSALTADDCAAIASLAIRHDLVVLSDEVYWALRYGGPHASVLDVRRHGGPDDPARRLVEDVRDDRLAARLRGVPGRAGGAGDPAGDQLGLLHLGVQPVRGDRGAGRAAGRGSPRWWRSSAGGATSSSPG